MHALSLAITLALFAVSPQQDVSKREPADLIVKSSSWKKFNLAVGGDRDPFAPNDMVRAEVQAAREAAVTNTRRLRTGEALVKPPMLQIRTSSLSDLKPGMAAYRYTIDVKNAGTKTISSVVWAYVFVDPESLQEVGRNYFLNATKISPGKRGDLEAYSHDPPTKVLNVKAPATTQLKESIEIYRIKYSDGSIWERPTEEPQ